MHKKCIFFISDTDTGTMIQQTQRATILHVLPHSERAVTCVLTKVSPVAYRTHFPNTLPTAGYSRLATFIRRFFGELKW